MARLKSLKRLFWFVLIGICLFVPAGTLAWPGAWIFLVLFVGGLFAVMGWLKRHDPALYEERKRSFRQADQPMWDKLIGLAIGVVWYGWIAGMSYEARGAAATPLTVLVAGAVLMAAGSLLLVSSFKANSFAATAVRLQTGRGQTVCDTGPYARVRHPIYSASILVHVGTALLLGTRWGFLGPPLLAVLLGLRAVLEEKTLRAGLAGYDAYMTKVRFRLVPFVW